MWILVIGVAVLLLVLVIATRGRSGAARPSDAAGSSDSTDSTDRAAGASTGVASETSARTTSSPEHGQGDAGDGERLGRREVPRSPSRSRSPAPR